MCALKFFRRNSVKLLELERKVVAVVKSACGGNLCYRSGIHLLEEGFRSLQTQNVYVFTEVESGFGFEYTRKMLGTYKIPARKVGKGDVRSKVILQELKRVVYIMLFLFRRSYKIRIPDQKEEEHVCITTEYLLAKVINVIGLGLYLLEKSVDLVYYIGIPVMIDEIREQALYRFGNIVIGTVDKHT